MLTEVRESFNHDSLLTAVCKFIDGSMSAPQTPKVCFYSSHLVNNFKAKCLTVQYLADLVEVMEVGSHINKNEVKCALTKIFQWYDDPKNHDTRPVSFTTLIF